MAKKYISLGQLSIATELLDFVNNELLPGTDVTKENFWSGLDKCVHELATKNKKLNFDKMFILSLSGRVKIAKLKK